MVQRNRDIAIIVLKCVIFGCCAGAQQTAFGTGMASPPKLAADGHLLVAQANAPAEPQAIVQETKNADAPAEPQAVMQEIKSAARLSSSKQRRRKPKMAGVPAGSQAVAKETKEPEPQAVAKEAEETDTLNKPLAVAKETKDAYALAKPQAEANGLKVGNAGKRKYGMAPIRWAVGISETVGWEDHSITYHPANGPSSSSQNSGFVNTQVAEIRAKTYILQPYIAQIGGNMGVVSNRNKGTGTNGAIVSTGTNDTRDNQLFGEGLLSLFSQSRFPFTMSLGVTNTHTDTEIQTQGMVTKHLNLYQIYTPLGSKSTYTAGYLRDTRVSNFNNWNTFSGINPNDTINHSLWQGSYSTSTPEQRISMTTRFNEKTTSTSEKTSRRADNFTVLDSYLPTDSLLSLNSTASLDSTDDTGLRSRFLQAYTNANWQPEDENIPLFLDGGVRLFRMSTAVPDGVASSTSSLSGSVNARYLFSRNLTGIASGGVTGTNSNGTRDLITTQRGSANYSSNAVSLWKNSLYTWNANGGASNQTGSVPDSSVFGGVGHGLSMPYTFNMFSKKFLMNSRINQSLNSNIARIDGRSITLVNGASISLGSLLASVRPDKELLSGYGTAEGAVNTTATLSVDDRRKIGGKTPLRTRTYTLILNLLEASKSVYSRYGIDFEATLGATQSTAGTELAGTGTAIYKKTRVFNVRGLDYIGGLKISTRSNSRVVDVNAQNPRFPWELDQRLRYKIGQNEVLLKGIINDQYGVKNASLWLLFRAWRTIGN